jgi:carbon-monoxide dehydrogenase medium subunit
MSNFVRHPVSVEEAVGLLAEIEGSRPIAGGASLVAMMNARLVEPSCVVSLERVEGLGGVVRQLDGGVRIGAMTRHKEIVASQTLAGAHALLSQAAGVIANRPVRNMGTLGGALANADPAADYLPALRCLDAEVEIAGPSGGRIAPISEFVVGWYETVLGPSEIVVAVRLPPLPPGPTLFRKVARVSGDYATASCALRVEEDGRGATLRASIGACGPGPLRDEEEEERLRGRLHDRRAIRALGEALQALADPIDDVRGSADYRRALIPRLIAAGAAELTGAGHD